MLRCASRNKTQFIHTLPSYKLVAGVQGPLTKSITSILTCNQSLNIDICGGTLLFHQLMSTCNKSSCSQMFTAESFHKGLWQSLYICEHSSLESSLNKIFSLRGKYFSIFKVFFIPGDKKCKL